MWPAESVATVEYLKCCPGHQPLTPKLDSNSERNYTEGWKLLPYKIICEGTSTTL